MRIAPLALRNEDREKLLSLTRSSTVMAGSAQRARIVLLAADGASNRRDRFAHGGFAPDGDRLGVP